MSRGPGIGRGTTSPDGLSLGAGDDGEGLDGAAGLPGLLLGTGDLQSEKLGVCFGHNRSDDVNTTTEDQR